MVSRSTVVHITGWRLHWAAAAPGFICILPVSQKKSLSFEGSQCKVFIRYNSAYNSVKNISNTYIQEGRDWVRERSKAEHTGGFPRDSPELSSHHRSASLMYPPYPAWVQGGMFQPRQRKLRRAIDVWIQGRSPHGRAMRPSIDLSCYPSLTL